MRARSLVGLILLAIGFVLMGAVDNAAEAQRRPRVNTMRAQTQAIQRAIQRQVRQALRPRLSIRGATGPVQRIATSPDGRYIATVLGDNTARIWDTAVGREVNALRNASISEIAITGNSGALITAVASGEVFTFDLYNGQQEAGPFPHGGAVTALASSADGGLIASGGADGVFRVWNVASGQQVQGLTGHQGAVTAIAFSPDGQLVATGGTDRVVNIWQVNSQTPTARLGQGGSVSALAFSANGAELIATSDNAETRVFTVAGGAQARGFSGVGGPGASVAVAANGSAVVTAAAGDRVRAWDAGSGALIADLEGHTGGVTDTAYDVTHARVLSASQDQSAKVWNPRAQGDFVQLISTRGAWATIDHAGRFDGDERALRDVSWVAQNDDLDLDSFSDDFNEPGLLTKAVAASPDYITRPQASVRDGIFLPPAATFANNTPTLSGNTIQVDLEVVDQSGQGIADVLLFHNGKRVPVQAGQGSGGVVSVSVQVPALPGVNTFVARGVSADRDIEGVPAQAQVNGPAASGKPSLHALVIGINDYAGQLALDYATVDAQAILQGAQLAAQPLFEEINVYPLLDGDATKANIAQVLNGMANLPPEDVVVIYLAGHGIAIEGEWYFIPADYRLEFFDPIQGTQAGISATEFEALLTGLGPRRVVLVMDACYSGAAILGIANSIERKVLRDMGRDVGLHLLAATRDDEVAYELPSLGQGLLTYTILQAVQTPAADTSGNRLVSASELIEYTKANLQRIARQSWPSITQNPTGYSRGADFDLFQ